MDENIRASLNRLHNPNNEVADHLIELQGEHEQAFESVSSSQLRRRIHTEGASMMFHIRLETHTPS